MNNKVEIRHIVTAILLPVLIWSLWTGGGVPFAPATITQATYVYEKDEGSVPLDVEAVLVEANRQGKILATVFEKDIVDDTNNTPQKYRIALKAAKEAGLPALVVQAGDSVVKVIKSPTTEEQVREAIQ